VAQVLVNQGKILQGLFFAHLVLEKALKPHVCMLTQDLAPKIHNLIKSVLSFDNKERSDESS